MIKAKPWRTEIGGAIGLLIGGALWWSAYEPGAGLFQKLQLIMVPVVLGILVVVVRNKRKKAGQFDEEHQAKNKRGRL